MLGSSRRFGESRNQQPRPLSGLRSEGGRRSRDCLIIVTGGDTCFLLAQVQHGRAGRLLEDTLELWISVGFPQLGRMRDCTDC